MYLNIRSAFYHSWIPTVEKPYLFPVYIIGFLSLDLPLTEEHELGPPFLEWPIKMSRLSHMRGFHTALRDSQLKCVIMRVREG